MTATDIEAEENKRIEVSRVELLKAAQQEALNDYSNPLVRVHPDGSTEITGENDTQIKGCYRIPVTRFVADHHTGIDEIRELHRDDPDTFEEEAREIWADAIELRDVIPNLYPEEESVTVEYIDE